MNQFYNKYNSNQFAFGKLDADSQPFLISKFSVKMFPTVLFLIPKNYKEIYIETKEEEQQQQEEEDEKEDAVNHLLNTVEKFVKYMDTLFKQFKKEKQNSSSVNLNGTSNLIYSNIKNRYAKIIEYDFYNYLKPFELETLELFAKKKLLLS